MKTKRCAAALAVSGALLLGTPMPVAVNADTVSARTKGATTDHNPLSGWEGYCTWGTQEQIHVHTGYYVRALTGNAEVWSDQARAAGWTVVGEAQPRSIAVYSSSLVGGVGHVAWVDAVDRDDLTIVEMNFGYGASAANGWRTSGFGQFDTRIVKAVAGMTYILIP